MVLKQKIMMHMVKQHNSTNRERVEKARGSFKCHSARFFNYEEAKEEMRDTNESTNSRVLYFSVFSMCCLLGLATWQVLYLRQYFKAKN
ncbi:unnamed protein product [Callosobruchus maculatus]|uniref:GOLD domain-containing protein n=1 Tax=Callosobruchus maculatus TaxID=64391 RepID=A0A653DSM9_CALMS|nr:unnamed protein product [Callosobruchus maculatus]